MVTSGSGLRVSARGVVLDDQGRYVLIRRVRTDGETYLVAPGGGIESGEAPADALRRECAEELGAVVEIGDEVWVHRHDLPPPGGVGRFLLCRLVSIDDAARSGHEFAEPERGSSTTVRIAHDDPQLDLLRPAELIALLRTRHERFRADAARL